MSQPEQGELFAAEDQAVDGVELVSVQSICPRCQKPGAFCEVEKHLERRSAPRKFCQRCRVVVNALGPGAESW